MENKFLAQAKEGKNGFGRYLLSFIVIIVVSQVIGVLPLLLVMLGNALALGSSITATSIHDLSILGIDQNLGLFLMIIPFAFGLIALWVSIKYIHKKKFKHVVTSRSKFSFGRFFTGAGVWLVLSGGFFAYTYYQAPENFTFQFQQDKFIVLLIIALVMLPIQTSFEEITFRGYMMQGVNSIFKRPIYALIITSLCFGLLHILNPEIEEYGAGIMLPQYIIFGLLFGLVTILDDGLEIALGVHAINNIFIVLFVTHESSVLQAPSLFQIQTINPVTDLYQLVLSALIFIAILSVIYKWENWKKLFEKVQ